MKKAYVKPALYAESFALAEHISAGCGYVANFGNGCPITVEGITYFTSEISCSPKAVAIFEANNIDPNSATVETLMGMNIQCYNSFVDFNMLFTS